MSEIKSVSLADEEEVEENIVVFTDDEGNEVYYQEDIMSP